MAARTCAHSARRAARWGGLLCVALLLFLSGCAHQPGARWSALEHVTALEQSPSLDPGLLEDHRVLALNRDAERFIDRQVASISDRHERLRALRKAVFDANGLAFEYDGAVTRTALETFQTASGNCLSLANFFVAAVRYLGIDARYQEVSRLDSSVDGELRVVEQHINVSGALSERARYVIDFLAVPEEDFERALVISDQRALAHYYNNLAIDRLQRGDLEVALQYSKKALRSDPAVDFAWSNLGVIYARRGDLRAADYAYRRALDLNERNVSALKNLVALYVRMGRDGEAEYYQELLRQYHQEESLG